MNELLQKHGCANVFTIPEGLKELMSDISREVLRDQPAKIFDFIANYLSVLLITREHGILAVRVLDDLCDCRPSLLEHLAEIGITGDQATTIADIIKEEIEGFEPKEGKETVKEAQIIKRILTKVILDEVKTAKVCQVARNSYRDYWYRKKLLEQSLKTAPEEPWEIAAERTLQIYKSTKPSFAELTRAAEKIQGAGQPQQHLLHDCISIGLPVPESLLRHIQWNGEQLIRAAYRGYHVRRNLLSHLKKPKKKRGPKVDHIGPPLDIAASREIDLGPLIENIYRRIRVVFSTFLSPFRQLYSGTPCRLINFMQEQMRQIGKSLKIYSDITVRQDDVGVMFDEQATQKLGLPYDPQTALTHVEDFDEDEEEGGKRSRATSRTAEPRSTKSLLQPTSGSRSEAFLEHRRSTKPSVSPSHIPEGVQSRLTSHITEPTPRQSVQQSPVQSAHVISFSEILAKVIPDEVEAKSLSQDMEEIKDMTTDTVVSDETAAQEALEVPEDITDDRSEGNEESYPTSSVPTSAPETDVTDVEDIAEDITTNGEEEG